MTPPPADRRPGGVVHQVQLLSRISAPPSFSPRPRVVPFPFFAAHQLLSRITPPPLLGPAPVSCLSPVVVPHRALLLSSVRPRFRVPHQLLSRIGAPLLSSVRHRFPIPSPVVVPHRRTSLPCPDIGSVTSCCLASRPLLHPVPRRGKNSPPSVPAHHPSSARAPRTGITRRDHGNFHLPYYGSLSGPHASRHLLRSLVPPNPDAVTRCGLALFVHLPPPHRGSHSTARVTCRVPLLPSWPIPATYRMDSITVRNMITRLAAGPRQGSCRA